MTTIYMPLLNEGAAVWRLMAAKRLDPDAFRVTGPMPDDEPRAFPPGSVGAAAPQRLAGGQSGIAAAAWST
jgi:hypothetical protein